MCNLFWSLNILSLNFLSKIVPKQLLAIVLDEVAIRKCVEPTAEEKKTKITLYHLQQFRNINLAKLICDSVQIDAMANFVVANFVETNCSWSDNAAGFGPPGKCIDIWTNIFGDRLFSSDTGAWHSLVFKSLASKMPCGLQIILQGAMLQTSNLSVSSKYYEGFGYQLKYSLRQKSEQSITKWSHKRKIYILGGIDSSLVIITA